MTYNALIVDPKGHKEAFFCFEARNGCIMLYLLKKQLNYLIYMIYLYH
jgi:hypothetical protein